MLKYKFQKTEGISKLLIELEALKIIFAGTKALPHIEENLRRVEENIPIPDRNINCSFQKV